MIRTQRTAKKKRTYEDDLELLSFLANHEVKEAAAKFHISEAAVRAWLNRLRRRLVKMQTFLNQVRTLQRTSQRIRKFTTPGGIPEQTGEDDA